MNPEDVLLWPDGFWCYRKDRWQVQPSHPPNYLLIPQWSIEWFRYARPQSFDRPRSKPPRPKTNMAEGT